MKLYDTVAIGCDETSEMREAASAMRAVLESFTLRADVYPLRRKSQVIDFFARPLTPNDHTVLCCHGDGATEAEMKIMLQVLEPYDGNYESRSMWYRESLDITPATLSGYAKNAGGTFISLACGGGREAWGKAFLDAGYDAYIGATSGPSSGPPAYVGHSAAILFTLGFFYHRMLANAEAYDHVPSLRECVEGAAGADRLYDYGTSLFRLYERADLTQ